MRLVDEPDVEILPERLPLACVFEEQAAPGTADVCAKLRRVRSAPSPARPLVMRKSAQTPARLTTVEEEDIRKPGKGVDVVGLEKVQMVSGMGGGLCISWTGMVGG